ncbi:MAG TPA: UPF0158 family protein [Oculatellaceae cyanobacterium]
MDKVNIDMPALIAAWADDSPDNLYYLDTRSGAVKLVHKHLFDLRDLTDEIEKNRERFLYIPKPEAGQIRKDLRVYLDKIETKSILPVLEMAFESPHVYSSFCKILEKEPRERDRFLESRQQLIRERINEWLEANNYEYDANYTNPYFVQEDDEEFDDLEAFDSDETNDSDFSPVD